MTRSFSKPRAWLLLVAFTLVAQTIPIVAGAPPADAQASTVTLVSNTAQSVNDGRGSESLPTLQRFTTGSNAAGYTLKTVGLIVTNLTSDTTKHSQVTVELWSATDQGHPGEKIADLTAPAALSNGENTFTVTGGATLDADTTYMVALRSTDDAVLRWSLTTSNTEEPGGQAGWTIHDNSAVYILNNGGLIGATTRLQSATSLLLVLKGTVVQQAASTKTYKIDSEVTAAEGGNAELTITLGEDAPTGDLAFSVMPTYTAGAGKAAATDVGTVPGSVTVSAGNKTATLSIPLLRDAVEEGNETFTVAIATSVTGWSVASDGTASATVTITDSTETVGFMNAAYSVDEGSSATVTVTRSGPITDAFTVMVSTITGAATATDYTAFSSRAVTIAAGSRTANVAIPTTADDVDEGAGETFFVTITMPAATTGYRLVTGVTTVTITDDDTAGVTVSEESLTVTAGEIDTYTVVLESKPTENVTVTPTSGTPANATVSAGVLFTPSNWNTTKTITVTGVKAGASTITHAASSADTNYQSSLSIDSLGVTVTAATVPTVSLGVSPEPVGEGSSVTVTATLSEALSSAVVVPVSISDVTTGSGDRGSLASITVAANALSGSGTVSTTGDSLVEGDETFTVSLGSLPASLAAGSTTSVTVTITDDEAAAAKVAFGNNVATTNLALTVDENVGGGTLNVPVTVSHLPQSSTTFMIEVLNTGTATETTDYSIATKSVMFTSTGNKTQNLAISINDDTLAEGHETIRLRIVAADAPANDLGDHYTRQASGSQATVTITDNDTPAAPTSLMVTEGDTRLDLVWTAPAGVLEGFDVHYTSSATVADDAAAGSSVASAWVDASHSGAAASHAITGLDNDTDYRVRVRATSAAGGGVWVHGTGTPVAATVPTVLLEVSPNPVVEGSSGTMVGGSVAVTVRLSEALSSAVSIPVTVAHVSTGSGDLGSLSSLTIPAGTTFFAGQLAIVKDSLVEADEMFTVSLGMLPSTVAAGTATSVTVTITDDDTAAAPSGLMVTEGDSRLDLVWTAPAGVLEGFDVHYTSSATVADSAAAGSAVATAWVDASHGGTTASHAISSLDNDTDYRVRVRATSAAGGGVWVHGTGTPVAPELPTVSLGVSPETVAEGSSVTVTATLSEALSSGVSIPVTVADVSTGSGDRGSLSAIAISMGDTSGTGTVSTVGDSLVEADETFTVSLGSLPASVAAGSPSSVTVTITDDDTAAAPTSLMVTVGDSRLDLVWTAPAGTLEGYDVHYTSAPKTGQGAVTDSATTTGANPATAWVDASHSGTTASHAITGLDNDTDYRVRVRAVSAAGDGVWVHGSGTPEAATLPVITLSSSDADGSVSESAGSVTITAMLPSAATSAVSVSLSKVSGSATAPADYRLGGSITIGSGNTSGTATLVVVDDMVDEDSETLVLRAAASGYAPGSLSLTITDNDTAGVSVSETTRTVEAGERATYTVVLDTKPTSRVTVTATSDNTARATVSPSSRRFTPANWATPKTFTVTGVAAGTANITHQAGGSDQKYPSTLSIGGVGVTVGASTKTYAVTSAVAAAEGANASLTVMLGRAAPTGGLSFAVSYDYSGSTATSADTGSTPATLRVQAGATTGTLTVPIAQDTLVEDTETFTVSLSTAVSGWNPASSGKNQATVTITDDDRDAAKVAFGSDAASTAAHTGMQSEDRTTLSVPVSVSHLPQTDTVFTVEVVSGGTAESGVDYLVLSLDVTFTSTGAKTQNLSVILTDDPLVEGDETIRLRIAAADAQPNDLGDHYERHASGSRATVTITDDDAAAAKIAFGSDAASTTMLELSVAEDVAAGTLSVPVTVSHNPQDNTTFTVEVLGSGSATENTDYSISAKTVEFTKAGAKTKNVTVTLTDDMLVEDAQTIRLRIAAADSPVNDLGDYYTRHASGSEATVTITDDDAAAAKVAFGSDAASTTVLERSVAEDVNGGMLNVPVTVSHNPEDDTMFTVEVLGSGSATENTDYAISTKTVSFAATGAKTKNLSITLTDDMLVEDAQTIRLRIVAADSQVNDLGDHYTRHTSGSEATVTITDDDAAAARVGGEPDPQFPGQHLGG